jgi:tripartite-type tricarboxylate transporter receptor subunit TctC
LWRRPAPGGLYSLFARIIAHKFEERLRTSFVVENRPGASSVVGSATFAHAAPDGHTLMVASAATMAVNVTLHKKLPYDPLADFMPIGMIARIPEVLVVNADLPVGSIAELKKVASQQPLTFASAGPGTAQHIEGEMLKAALGIGMTHVPYKGDAGGHRRCRGRTRIADVCAGRHSAAGARCRQSARHCALQPEQARRAS